MDKLMKFLDRNGDKLLEDAGVRTESTAQPKNSKLEGRLRMQNAASIAIDKIVADPQHREQFDEESLQRLANSLKSEGQLQPIRVRWDEARGLYIIIAGERRMRAAQIAGLTHLDCVIVEGPIDNATILRQQIIENALRDDLKPVEKAKAFKAAMEMEGLEGKQLAEKLHIDPSTVSRSLALLKLPEDVQKKVDAGIMPPTVAIKQLTKEVPRGKGRGAKRSSNAKERTFRCDGGIVVIVKGRRNLEEGDVVAALQQTLTEVQGVAAKAA